MNDDLTRKVAAEILAARNYVVKVQKLMGKRPEDYPSNLDSPVQIVDVIAADWEKFKAAGSTKLSASDRAIEPPVLPLLTKIAKSNP